MAGRITLDGVGFTYTGSETAVLADIFRTLTSRRPTKREQQVLTTLYEQQLEYFQQDGKRADQYLKTGDSAVDQTIDKTRLAAAASVANTLLSFDEAVMRR